MTVEASRLRAIARTARSVELVVAFDDGGEATYAIGYGMLEFELHQSARVGHHRLCAGRREVEDREASMPEREPSPLRDPAPRSVRPSVRDRAGHRVDLAGERRVGGRAG